MIPSTTPTPPPKKNKQTKVEKSFSRKVNHISFSERPEEGESNPIFSPTNLLLSQFNCFLDVKSQSHSMKSHFPAPILPLQDPLSILLRILLSVCPVVVTTVLTLPPHLVLKSVRMNVSTQCLYCYAPVLGSRSTNGRHQTRLLALLRRISLHAVPQGVPATVHVPRRV